MSAVLEWFGPLTVTERAVIGIVLVLAVYVDQLYRRRAED